MTKPKKFYTAKKDIVFKTIFLDKNDYTLMEALLSNVLNEKVKIIEIYNNELGVKDAYERTKRVDALIKINNKMVHLELNSDFNISIKYRNYIFFEAFHSNEVRKSDKYDYQKLYYHIDLSFKLGSNHKPIDIYTLNNHEGFEYIENVKYYVVNMDLIKKFWYDKNVKEIEKYKYLIMVDLLKEDLENYASYVKDNLVNEYKERIIKMNEIFSFDNFISPEKDEQMLFNTRLMEHEEIGMEKGKAEIVKNMLKDNEPIEKIMKYTGLTKKEIAKIQKEL